MTLRTPSNPLNRDQAADESRLPINADRVGDRLFERPLEKTGCLGIPDITTGIISVNTPQGTRTGNQRATPS